MGKKPDLQDLAVKAAFEEICKQVPGTVDCSPDKNYSAVLIPDGIDLRAIVATVLAATP
jgi:hypothetical protein